MNLTLRAKIVLTLLVIIVGFLIIFAIIRLASLANRQQQQSVNTPTTQAPAQVAPSTPEPSIPPITPSPAPVPPPQRSAGEADLASLGMPFVERFGSYSNQSSFENLSDLLPFMTEDFKKWAQGKINDQLQKPYQPIYQGVTTKALSYTMNLFDEKTGIAEMVVSTQRREMIGSPANTKTTNQDITLKFVKNDDVWLVDHAEWK